MNIKIINSISLILIISSIGISPAFASLDAEINTAAYGVPIGSTYEGPQIENDCAGLKDKCGAQLIVRNTNVDFIYLYYKIGGSGVVCDITFYTTMDGKVIGDTTFKEHETYGKWEYVVMYVPEGIDPTSTIESKTFFEDCYVLSFER